MVSNSYPWSIAPDKGASVLQGADAAFFNELQPPYDAPASSPSGPGYMLKAPSIKSSNSEALALEELTKSALRGQERMNQVREQERKEQERREQHERALRDQEYRHQGLTMALEDRLRRLEETITRFHDAQTLWQKDLEASIGDQLNQAIGQAAQNIFDGVTGQLQNQLVELSNQSEAIVDDYIQRSNSVLSQAQAMEFSKLAMSLDDVARRMPDQPMLLSSLQTSLELTFETFRQDLKHFCQNVPPARASSPSGQFRQTMQQQQMQQPLQHYSNQQQASPYEQSSYESFQQQSYNQQLAQEVLTLQQIASVQQRQQHTPSQPPQQRFKQRAVTGQFSPDNAFEEAYSMMPQSAFASSTSPEITYGHTLSPESLPMGTPRPAVPRRPVTAEKMRPQIRSRAIYNDEQSRNGATPSTPSRSPILPSNLSPSGESVSSTRPPTSGSSASTRMSTAATTMAMNDWPWRPKVSGALEEEPLMMKSSTFRPSDLFATK